MNKVKKGRHIAVDKMKSNNNKYLKKCEKERYKMEVIIMNDEEIDNLIHQMIFGIPKDDNKSIISAYEGIDMDDLTATIRRLKKVPDINDLMKENKKLTNNWNELEEWIRTLIDENNNRYELYKDDKLHYEYEISNIKYQNNMLLAFLDKMKEIKDGNNDKD